MKIFADEDMGSVEVTLVNADLWNSFHALGTEMIITKTGRRMFPSLQLQVTGLDPDSYYSLLVEFSLASPHKYKYKTSWEPVGDAERHLAHPGARLYTHPHGKALGGVWMIQPLHLNKIKLANAFVEGTILLNSMHKYIPRIHLVKQSTQPLPPWESAATSRVVFAFPNTEFIAVTAYANDKITQLKIENNPFAKGFRSEGNYGKRKLKAKSTDDQENCKRRRVSEEINVVDVDDEESETKHFAPSKTTENFEANDEVFETTKSVKQEDTTTVTRGERHNTKENHPVSSNVMRRLEERVHQRNQKSSKGRNNGNSHEPNRTPNAAIKTLNNITNQIPNIELCHECKKLRTQYYRPWESDSMCHCRRSSNNIVHSSDSRQREPNVQIFSESSSRPIKSESNMNSFHMSRILDSPKPNSTSPKRDILSHVYVCPVPTYNMYHPAKPFSPHAIRGNSSYLAGQEIVHVQPTYPRNKMLIPVPSHDRHPSESPRDLSVASRSENQHDHKHETYPFEKRMSQVTIDHQYERCSQSLSSNHERSRIEVHRPEAISDNSERLNDRNSNHTESHDDISDQELISQGRHTPDNVVLDFSIRDEEARSPSNVSVVSSSSSGYESRNSSSNEMRSPSPSPATKYDRYYSLPNISIVTTLF